MANVNIKDQVSGAIAGYLNTIPELDKSQVSELSAVDYGRVGHGDLTTPVAMRLAKMLHANPKKFADEVANAITAAKIPAVEKVEAAGPGFLNIYLDKKYWLALIKQINAEGASYGRSDFGKKKKVQLEFASANPTGPLSVAHGRQAAIGDVLGRIMSFIGYDVTTEYWINDCGNQINKLGESVYVRYLQQLGKEAELPENGYRGEYIIDMAKELLAKDGAKYADMPKKQAIAELGLWAGSTIFQQCLDDFKRFGLQHSSLFSQRKFEAEGHVERLVERMKKDGLAYEKEGALWMKTSAFGDDEDRVLIKSDGLWAYRLSDIAYHEDKFKRGFEQIIDLLGPDHHGHIITMYAALKALGHDTSGLKFLIVQHCTIIREGKKVKMSTRAGELITLEEVIRDVGVDVARFFFLTRKNDSHLDFDLELAKKQSSDNPVYYIQYAHARIASIMRKAAETGRMPKGTVSLESLDVLGEHDLALAAQLGRFPSVLEKAAVELEPHRLTNYLQELAAEFHTFYTQCPVVSDDEKLTRARLELVLAVKAVLSNALNLLGVNIPDVM